MLCLVIGGSASGKSEYAERHVCALPGRRIYAATMQPFGEEGRQRIARHRKLREGKGFVTVEVPRDLGDLTGKLRKERDAGDAPIKGSGRDDVFMGKRVESREYEYPNLVPSDNKRDMNHEAGYNILLEDLPNLIANELFAEGELCGTAAERAQKSDMLFSKMIRVVEDLARISENLTIVTGDIFSDGVRYDLDTEEYRHLLGKMNCRIAEMADHVVRVTAGCPVRIYAKSGMNIPDRIDKGSGMNISAGIDMESELNIPAGIDMESELNFPAGGAESGMTPADLEYEPEEFGRKQMLSEGKSGMVFVTGPLASGKSAWVREKLGICDENMTRASDIFQAEENALESQNLYPGDPEKICVTDVQDLVGKSPMSEEELTELADRLAGFRAVIATEVGCGVIPLDRGERIWRENAGRLACLLADRADEVVLVQCGIGIPVKPRSK
ncbi:MAG: bifunctional adenosylcobinamide kinase/adenosylcobinamide-phosphate guanylyltransferase [Lachnospiraceae bacterium]|nr:bifunctional adenosylcobinamide kinase/adenosylcobinamide-phosphate guanylyltransferase [Lachnospiraceae bacterium]